MSINQELDQICAQNSKEHKDVSKRPASSSVIDVETKKIKVDPASDETARSKRKKVAMLVIYSGKGFYGLQRCPGVRTIEEEVQRALVSAGVISQDDMDSPLKMQFQRSARTDKGVSAVGQVLSLKMDVNNEDAIRKANEELPPQIRIIGYKRVIRSFDSKNMCSHRTYSYVTPSFAFAPCTEFITEAYRITPEILTKVNELLALYKGTKNFFNYTSGRKYTDPSSKRYIMDMTCSEPWLQGDMEFVRITVVGQSFMLHQIRKMIGMVIAIIKGHASMANYHRSWAEARLDVPKAPGLGLMLEKVHYRGYDKRYGDDGIHQALTWDEYRDEIDRFKAEHIYKDLYETELEERSMLKWLSSLTTHHFDVQTNDLPVTSQTGVGRASRRAEMAESNGVEKSSVPSPESVQESSSAALPLDADTDTVDARKAKEEKMCSL